MGNHYPAVTPYLLYRDAARAIDWLTEAFGLTERLRHIGDDGRVGHAELTVGDGVVMIGSPGPDFAGPDRDNVTALVHCYVEDVDAHHARAVAAGADVVKPPTDEPYGDRRYDVYDLDGHLWSFATHVRDVPPEDWGALTP